MAIPRSENEKPQGRAGSAFPWGRFAHVRGTLRQRMLADDHASAKLKLHSLASTENLRERVKSARPTRRCL
jgi:hypothetical protein